MKCKLGLALAITAQAFKHKMDRGDVPYMMHCLYVMDHADGNDDEKCAYVMHDLIEDTDEKSEINWTFDKLLDEGFSNRTIEILKYLTHDSKYTYMEYINRIAEDQSAIKGKKADLEHNSMISRLKGVQDKDFERIKKYNIAYQFLTSMQK